jgi:hypothetical protein
VVDSDVNRNHCLADVPVCHVTRADRKSVVHGRQREGSSPHSRPVSAGQNGLSSPDCVRVETEAQLDLFVAVPYEGLFMRPPGDNRKDAIVKREIFETEIRGRWRIAGVSTTAARWYACGGNWA